jgi:hypothetical protein
MALQIDSLHLILDITGYFLQNIPQKAVLGTQNVKDGLNQLIRRRSIEGVDYDT